jgi:hypothetical protein
MIPWMVPDDAARALKATISTSPTMIVRLPPIRLDTHPVNSMATAVTTR